jgi:hypothetical protein
MRAQRPNTRVQRTRSSASPPHSPLTRSPLGGHGLSLGVALGACAWLSLGCETFNGKSYLAIVPPAFRVASACESPLSEQGWTVAVEVRDDLGGALPGVTVRYTLVDGGRSEESVTNTQGLATAQLSPGVWRIETRLGGFTSAHHTLELTESKACRIEVMIRIDSKAAVTVT